jgi:hypothetical protein
MIASEPLFPDCERLKDCSSTYKGWYQFRARIHSVSEVLTVEVAGLGDFWMVEEENLRT